MDELDALDKYIAENPSRAFFGAPASDAEIKGLEEHIGTTLPASLVEFLERHNGGFISSETSSDDSDWDLESEQWNSIRLMSVDAIRENFTQLKTQLEEIDLGGEKKYIPCIVGSNQELLVFDQPESPSTEPRILDAFHECPPDEWEPAFKSFAAFLRKYIENEGDADTVASG